MADDATRSDVTSHLEAARLVYGAVLPAESSQPSIVECVDDGAFEDGTSDAALYTAFNSIGANLVPFVSETEPDDEPAIDGDDDLEHITAFDGAASSVADARAYYLVCNTPDGRWTRLRDATGGSDDPQASKYVVAAALVDEASARIAELPPTVDAEDVGLVNWSD